MAGHVSHTSEPSIWPCSPRVSHSSVVRASNRHSGRSWVRLPLGGSQKSFSEYFEERFSVIHTLSKSQSTDHPSITVYIFCFCRFSCSVQYPKRLFQGCGMCCHIQSTFLGKKLLWVLFHHMPCKWHWYHFQRGGRGVTLCQNEGTHQIVMWFLPPVVGCLLKKMVYKGRGYRHSRTPPPLSNAPSWY